MDLPRENATAAPMRAVQATAHWADPDELERVGYSPGETWFGYTLTERRAPFGYSDDRHIVTIAGNRAGKGTAAIIPNLCEHPGSLICIDPKGENATITAARRGKGSAYAEGMGQQVWVLDPFKAAQVDDSVRGSFNPLDCIDPESPDAVDDAAAIAESLIVPSNSKDVHWDESARIFLQGLILYVAVDEPPKKRNLQRVRELLTLGDRAAAAAQAEKNDGEEVDPFSQLLFQMMESEEYPEVIAGAASTLLGAGENERGSILSTARRNTSFMDSPGMRDVLGESSFTLDDLKNAPEGLSIYLCLPARRLDTHGRWLRTMVMLALGHMERLGSRAATGYPVLFLLDEFATLGHLSSLEKAAGFIAGYGVKLWVILQDLNQLKANYKERWETFLGNAGVLQFFGNSDMTTLEYISKRLGETEFRQQTTGSSTSESESSSLSRSQSESFSSGQSSSRSGGSGSSGWSRGTNASQGETSGTSESSTHGTSSSISRNETIAVAPLMRPDELAKAFGRGTGRQILFVAGAPPVVLGRTIYFQDPYFLGKFDPHPDHPESAPPTLEDLKVQRLEADREAKEQARLQEERHAQLVAMARRRARWRKARPWLIGLATLILVPVIFGTVVTWIAVSSEIPTSQIGFKITGYELERASGAQSGDGHMILVDMRLDNRSRQTMESFHVGFDAKVCKKRSPGGKWTGCEPLELPESKWNLNDPVPPDKHTYASGWVGPVRELNGTLFLSGRLTWASE